MCRPRSWRPWRGSDRAERGLAVHARGGDRFQSRHEGRGVRDREERCAPVSHSRQPRRDEGDLFADGRAGRRNPARDGRPGGGPSVCPGHFGRHLRFDAAVECEGSVCLWHLERRSRHPRRGCRGDGGCISAFPRPSCEERPDGGRTARLVRSARRAGSAVGRRARGGGGRRACAARERERARMAERTGQLRECRAGANIRDAALVGEGRLHGRPARDAVREIAERHVAVQLVRDAGPSPRRLLESGLRRCRLV